MEFGIKAILEEDIQKIYEIGCGEEDFSADGGKNCFWPKSTLSKLAKSENDVALKLVVNEKIVGFSLVMIHPVTKKAVLENFYVTKEYNYLENKFYLEVENQIKEKGAQFIAYFYDSVEDVNDLELFKKNGYFEGNSHLWMHKNISFSNPFIKK